MNFIKGTSDKKIYQFELTKTAKGSGVVYTTSDLILISKQNPNILDQKEHLLAIVERYNSAQGIIYAKVVLRQQDKRSTDLYQHLKKNSEWITTRICNLATINREYQALHAIDSLKLKDVLIYPFNFQGSLANNAEEYFHIPKRLDYKLKTSYNSSQFDAIKSSIKKKGVTLIQGPPGTGKSTTILGILSVILSSLVKKEENIRKDSLVFNENFEEEKSQKQKNEALTNQQPWLYDNGFKNWMDETIPLCDNFYEFPTASKTDTYKIFEKVIEEDITPPEKILVCAPSNVAIDEIVRKILSNGLTDSSGNTYSPKFVRVGPNFSPDVREITLDFIVNQHSVSDSINSNQSKDSESIKSEILTNVKIVCATPSMAGSGTLITANQKFDTVVIDEAAQAVEVSTLIPLKYGCERLILVGDPKQLEATIFSRTAKNHNYDQSLFKRFQEAGHEVLVLKTQYRMHKTISKFISDTFYDGLLIDYENIHLSTENERCFELQSYRPLTYYDIESEETFNGSSYYNNSQIQIILNLIQQLNIIYTPEQIAEKLAIISPYSAQVQKIKESIRYLDKFNTINIEVNTVDGFQGREKTIIIFSTVRSKGSKSIGFLSNERRMNVGLSRAKSSLIVIGDSKKLITDQNWEKLVKYAFRSATFYKVKNPINDYFTNFEANYREYLVTDENEFVKQVYVSKS